MRGFLNLLTTTGLLLLVVAWSIILYPQFWDGLRDLGLPVPYCTANKLAIGCEYASGTYAHVHKVVTSSPVYVSLVGNEPVDFLNTVCTAAKKQNVFIFVNDAISASDDIASSLVSCGAKVKKTYVRSTIAVSPSSLLLITDDIGVFTDCDDAVGSALKTMQRRWELSP